MTNQALTISAKCRDNEECIFKGSDVFLDIAIANEGDGEVRFPLAYVQKTGPIVKLTDARTKQESYVRTNPAEPELRDEFTSIRPGESANFEWVITADELQQFGGQPVDVSAEIIVMATIQISGSPVAFRGTDTLRIIGKDGS